MFSRDWITDGLLAMRLILATSEGERDSSLASEAWMAAADSRRAMMQRCDI
jgi:hypothetical protein